MSGETDAVIQRPVAWLDDDGQHVWTAHDCRGEWTVVMLPHPQWHAMGSGDDRLIWMHPSFDCVRCRLHEFLPIVMTSPMADYGINSSPVTRLRADLHPEPRREGEGT